MKKILISCGIILLGIFIIIEKKAYFLQKIIFIKGNVELPKEFIQKLKPNSILYITLRNDKGIIFGIKKIINPKAIMQFEINHKNVLYPDLITLNTEIQAHINTHGNVGEIREGDIYSDIVRSPIINPRLTIHADRIKN